MPVVEGFRAEEVGECSVTTDNSEGPFVTSPYMVTLQMANRPFTLGAPIIRAFASALDLRNGEQVDEELDRKDQRIADLEATVEAQEDELKTTRPAAERYFILKGQENGTNYEEQLANANEKVARLEKQLQQLNRGGRPRKEAA